MFPEFLKIGDFVVYWYGVMVALGVLTAGLIFQRLAKRQGYKPELISQIIFWTVLWGIAGGRLLHVSVQFPYYYRNPLEIFSIRNGGLAAEGAIISGFVFIAVYSKIRRFNLFRTLDILAVPVPLAQALGRLGCFLNGCCYGKPTDCVFGVAFPHLQARVHPTQLYYAAAHLVLFVFLLRLYKKKVKEGAVFSAYLMCFSLIRYTIDHLRGDLPASYLGLHPTQAIAVLLFITGASMFWASSKKTRGGRTVETGGRENGETGI